MTDVYEVDPAQPAGFDDAVHACAAATLRGELVVFPTETVYGLAGRPEDAGATARVFVAKRRPRGLNLPVLAPSAESALGLTERSEASELLAERFWPGPLTLVLRRARASSGWSLGDEQTTIAVRVPDHPISLALLAAAGPLATTSANLSGHPPLLDGSGLVEAFGDAVAIYLVLPKGLSPPAGKPSTVVDLTSDSLRIAREGPIDRRALVVALEGFQASSTG